MSDYNIDDPGVTLKALVARVREGQKVTLTEDGRPVAEVTPAAGADAGLRPLTEAEWDAIRARSAGRKITLNAVELVRKMRDEGY